MRSRSVQHRPLDGIPQSLWEFARLAHWHLLIVDYDATLAPLYVSDSEARPLHPSLRLLRRIVGTGRTTLGVASIKPVADLDAILGPFDAAFVGEHRWERREPGEPLVQFRPSQVVLSALERAARAAIDTGWESRLKRTRTSVCLSTADTPVQIAELLKGACTQLWYEEAKLPGMRLLDSSVGIELRAWERNLGTAELALITHAPPGTLLVYLGDDRRDEEAFALAHECGYAIRVGGDDRPSIASGRLRSYEEVHAFFESWLEASAGGTKAPGVV
jgi:trehalose 6-phosphate phosphatase